MNREQRRRYRKIAETKKQCLDYLIERQDLKEEARLSLYAVAIGLAHHALYGKGRDEFIEPFIREWNDQIKRIVAEDISFEELQQELYDKTEVHFEVV